MDTIALKVQKRDQKKLAKAIRAEGMVPGICYGNGKDNVSFQVDYQEFRKVYMKAGENTIIDLDVEGEKFKVLVHELQYDPMYNMISHVDCMIINMKEKIDTHVPVVFVGESPAVKEEAGTLNVSLDEIAVRCLPSDIPHEFQVDISGLIDFHTTIHVSDIKFPENVEVLTDLELSVVSVSAPRVEVEPETTLTPEEAEKAAVLAAAGPEAAPVEAEEKDKKKD